MQNADLILIPLLDGTFLRAQVDSIGTHFANLLLSDQVVPADAAPKPLTNADIVALIAVTPNDLQWPVIGYDAVPRLKKPEHAPQDPAIAEALANAIHGLYPWDGFPDPMFFTSFLRDPSILPDRARLTADFPKPDAP